MFPVFKRFLGFVLLSGIVTLLFPLPAAAEPSCTVAGSEAPPVVIVAAEAFDDDLAVALQWGTRSTATDPELVLATDTGTVIASRKVQPSLSTATEEVLPGVLSNLWSDGFALTLVVEDHGIPISEPLPLFALRECTPQKCAWDILVGVVTTAIVMTPALELEISRYQECDLGIILSKIDQELPYLAEEIAQMIQQMDKVKAPIGGIHCGYYWQVVADIPSDGVQGFAANTSWDGGEVDAQAGGFTAGAGYSHAAQARRLSEGVTEPPLTSSKGATTLSMNLRCSSGPPSCAAACEGKVDVELDYHTCSTTAVDKFADGGTGTAGAWEDLSFAVGKVEALQESLGVQTTGGEADQKHVYHPEAESPVPVTVTLRTLRTLLVDAAYAPPVNEPLPVLPPQGAVRAYAESGNDFLIEAIGDTSGQQCPASHSMTVTVQSPNYLAAMSIQERGGIQIEKW